MNTGQAFGSLCSHEFYQALLLKIVRRNHTNRITVRRSNNEDVLLSRCGSRHTCIKRSCRESYSEEGEFEVEVMLVILNTSSYTQTKDTYLAITIRQLAKFRLMYNLCLIRACLLFLAARHSLIRKSTSHAVCSLFYTVFSTMTHGIVLSPSLLLLHIYPFAFSCF